MWTACQKHDKRVRLMTHSVLAFLIEACLSTRHWKCLQNKQTGLTTERNPPWHQYERLNATLTSKKWCWNSATRGSYANLWPIIYTPSGVGCAVSTRTGLGTWWLLLCWCSDYKEHSLSSTALVHVCVTTSQEPQDQTKYSGFDNAWKQGMP